MAINNLVKKKMSAGGPEIKQLDMEQFIKLADDEKTKSDIKNTYDKKLDKESTEH